MDAQELFSNVYDDAGFQLNAVFANFPDDKWDAKVDENALSAKETLIHLAEASTAAKKMLNGEEHKWGSYSPPSDDYLATLKSVRDEVKNLAIEKGSDTFFKVMEYTANHEFYHVGQMCTLRLHLDPAWNAYSIYQ